MRNTAAGEDNFKFDLIKSRIFSPFGFIFIIQVCAFWAAWRWLGLRVWTSVEERWSFAALAAAIFFAFFWTKTEPGGETAADAKQPLPFYGYGLASSIFFTFLYAASFAFAPPFPRAILAMAALTFTLSVWRLGKTFHVGLWSLLLLSLPSAASLQFFLGYPMRVVVGRATAFLLQMQGLDVWREGVCLHFGEKLIWIDAPCSGIKMLWFGLFLAAFLVCFYRLTNPKSLALLASAFFIILLGNVFRASALFYIEAEIVKAPAFMHEATGVFAFIFIAVGIVFAAQFWSNVRNNRLNSIRNQAAAVGFLSNLTGRQNRIRDRKSGAPKIFVVFFLAACTAAFAASFRLPVEKNTKTAAQNFSGFPDAFEAVKIKELPLSERESYFLEDFPGRVGRFTDGRREIIIRFVREATRKLHPAADCFRAIGYSTKPLPLKIDRDGKRWSCFSAARADERLRVCERIYDEDGGEWTDVSAWYWTALNKPAGGWWAITVAERAND